MNNIKEILAHKFTHNFPKDYRAFEQISQFIHNETNPMAHRAEALRYMWKEGMGICSRTFVDAETDEMMVYNYCKPWEHT